MNDFTETAMRHMCRYPKCRSRLKEPTSSPRDAFCARGCSNAYYRTHCRVCDGVFERKNDREHTCGRRGCRNAFSNRRGDFFGLRYPEIRISTTDASDTDEALKTPIKPGLKSGLKDGRDPVSPWLHKGLHKEARGLNPWRWVASPDPGGEWREDDDWGLRDRKGRMPQAPTGMVARVRQEGDGYWVSRPRITPEPPIESFEAACRRAVDVAMNTLAWPESEKHPLHPGMTVSQFEAARRDLSRQHPDWSAKEVDQYISRILKPETGDHCLIKRKDSPVNVLGGYKSPDTPVIDLSPTDPAEQQAVVRMPSPPLVPTDDPLSIPDFLRRI